MAVQAAPAKRTVEKGQGAVTNARSVPWAVVTAAAFAGGVALLIYAGRDMWFFTDEWAFLLTRRDPTLDAYMRPHNEHWVAFHVLVYQVLVAAFGVTSYLPYFVTASVLQLAATVAGWVVLRRLGVPRVPALLAALSLLLMGSADEQLFNAFQLGWTAPIALCVTAFLFLDDERPGRRGEWTAAALLAVAMPFGGVALGFCAGIAAALVLRRRFLAAVLVVAPALLLYGVWRAVWGIAPPVDAAGLRGTPGYVAYGLSASLAGFTSLPLWAGAGLVALIVVAAVVLTLLGRLPFAGAAALLSVGAFFASAGLARVVLFGVRQAGSSRYLYIGALLLVISAAACAGPLWTGRARLPATVLASVLLTGCLLLNLLDLREGAREFRQLKGDSAARISAADELLAEGLPHVPVAQPDPMFAPDVNAEELLELRDEGLDLDYTGPVVPNDRERETQRLRLQVAFTPVPDVTADLRLVFGFAEVAPRQDGCADLTIPSGQTLEFASSPGRLRIEPHTASVVQVSRGQDPEILFERGLSPGPPQQLELTLPAEEDGPDGLLVLGFPQETSLTLCARTFADARAS